MFSLHSKFSKQLLKIEKYLSKGASTNFILILTCLISSFSYSQNWNNGLVYIQNKQTGEVIDVKGNLKSPGTVVWPYTLNHTHAQLFRFNNNVAESDESSARYIMAYKGAGQPYNLYLTVKKKQPQMVEVTETENPSDSNIFTDPPEFEIVTSPSSSEKKIHLDYNLIILDRVDQTSPSGIADSSVSLIDISPKADMENKSS